MLEALKNPETLKGLAETESDIQQRIDKFVTISNFNCARSSSKTEDATMINCCHFSVSLLPLSGFRALAAGSPWFVILT